MNKESLIKVILDSGYKEKDYGYVKTINDYIHLVENTHWITLFGEGKLQLYGYSTEDNKNFEKIYDTGIIDIISILELKTLIKTFNNNHN